MTDKDEHAKENARAHLDGILSLWKDYTGAETPGDSDEAAMDAESSVLEVCVRSGWHHPGSDEGTEPSEYYLLLTTGGPALRVIGELDEAGEASTARLEYQDWGTPWTEYRLTEEESEAVQGFARIFYFGE